MAATANNNPPPPPTSSSSSSAAATLSPRLNRVGSPPWTQIVKGPESETIGAPNTSTEVMERSNSPVAEIAVENSENGGNAGGKKPVWNKKPSNGPVENGGPGPVVMGPSEAWPALSESTKASPKLSSSDSPKILPDFGSVSSPQVLGTESSSLSITPPMQSPSQMASTSHKPTTTNHNPTPNHGRPARQKSMKREGGGNPQANGGFSHPPSSVAEGLHSHNNSSPKPSSGVGSESSGRDSSQNHGHRESGPRSAGGDHSQSRNSYNRRGSGPHSRGEGSHQNYGGRRGDQDRGNHDWNHQRSFNGRDASMQSRGSGRGFVRPQPVSTPFVHPTPMPAMRPYMNPLEVPTPVYLYPGMPYAVHTPMFIPPVDPQLYANIKNQIEYYFSNENLVKDIFLRQNMDENGWVHVTLIARFKKVMQLTDNIQQILDAVRSSDVVEVKVDKIRKRDDWKKWIMPATVQFPTASGLQSPKSPTLAAPLAHRQNVKVDEKSIDQNHPKAHLDVDAANILRSSSGDLSSPLHTVKDGASSSGR